MPVPFETLIPYGIMIAMFGITGTGLHVIKGIQNGGKKPRWGLDQWDRYAPSPVEPYAIARSNANSTAT
ncbi:hypothetical protein CORC01_11224 [Colletotrichum orchidophilum]|uniref:NADH dehydrogenase [ubiquinone] 1 alpha subcomplex subunit 1 n=1 Tax=Colletotrichum orchidophilum TaxID=1209926 RepID=A0A1G4AWA6_9PEZI|nr:uncharacterized protein CORC01_11224 [Colletotrichum orchidophilum]OHE93449.1 hypothetical protein CORC01_11224 [Colletotrichum orchidophilum]